MSSAVIPYLLVVRWPLGGIRTHLKYARQLSDPHGPILAPSVIAFDDSLTRLLLDNLAIPAQNDLTRGVTHLHQMAARIWRACFNPKIKVVHSQGFISALLAAPAALLTGKRHVISAHDLADPRVIGSNPWVHRALGLTLRQAYAVHAVGEDCAHSLRALPFMGSARNIVVIENGIDAAQFTAVAPLDLRAQLQLPADARLVGSFGRYMPQKGFRLLVDALRQLRREHPGLNAHVISLGAGDFIREEQAYVEQCGLSSQVHFLPPASDPARWIAGCEVIAMPSLWEAYGLLAAETLALGVPLIASACLGLREVIAGTPARSITPGNVAELAQALHAELSSSSNGAAAAYAQTARGRFDFRANAARLQRLLALAHIGCALPEDGRL